MLAYIVRRLLLIIPTLIGIMVINFVIVQAAPGGPIEQMLAQLQGTGVDATARQSTLRACFTSSTATTRKNAPMRTRFNVGQAARTLPCQPDGATRAAP